ncbi:MAG TPA: hypothetical protein VER08_11210 [Pyrinomonadaceae bacterium]|nr:hypothetical protein [Pyrinomonadaceae bacterium]
MSKRWQVLTAAVALAAVFAGGAAWAGLSKAGSAAAQGSSPESRRADGPRWEYCAVSRAHYGGSSRGGIYWISYFREAGVQVVEVEESAVEKNGMAKAIARLGEEGWEMVGPGQLDIRTGTSVNAIYFKRPKP